MTPKEKAKELVDKMLIGFVDWTYHIPIEINNNHTILSEAKQRALITVDEIRDIVPLISNIQEYWIEVKREIKII